MKNLKQISRLTDHLGYWMRMVSNSVSHAFANKLESTGVTVAEWVILREMYGNEELTSPSRVAELTGLTRGAVSKLIQRLFEKGLINRKESTDDRRYQDIELTEKAIKLVPKLAEIADDNDRQYFGGLTAHEQIQLRSLLEKLAERNEIKAKPVE